MKKTTAAVIAICFFIAAGRPTCFADFSYSIKNPNADSAKTYIISTSNITISTEGIVTYWHPATGSGTEAASLPGVIIYHFPLTGTIAEATLYITTAAFHWSYSQGHTFVYISTDGNNWTKLAEAAPPEFGKGRSGNFSGLLPEMLVGKKDIYVKVELYSYGPKASMGGAMTNTAQHLRYSSSQDNVTFQLDVAYQKNTAIKLPEQQQIIPYTPVRSPATGAVVEDIKPIGVGAVAGNGKNLNLQIALRGFSSPADFYLGISYNLINDIFLFKEDGTLCSFLSEGLAKWKQSFVGNINEQLFDTVPISALPVGVYTLYLLVTPVDSVEKFYLWTTSFEVPYTNGHAINQLVSLAREQESLFWNLVGIFSNDFTILPFDEGLTIDSNDYLTMTSAAGKILDMKPGVDEALRFLAGKVAMNQGVENMVNQSAVNAGGKLESGASLLNTYSDNSFRDFFEPLGRLFSSLFNKARDVVYQGDKNLSDMWEANPQLRQTIYKTAKDLFPYKVADSPEAFIRQVKQHQLRNETNHIFATVTKTDGSGDADLWARKNNKTTGKIVAQKGTELMVEGGKTILDAATKIVPAIGEAKNIIENLNKLGQDPEGYLAEKTEVYEKKVTAEFLVREVGLNEDIAQKLADRGIDHIRYRIKRADINNQRNKADKIKKIVDYDFGYVTPEGVDKTDEAVIMVPHGTDEPSTAASRAAFILMMWDELKKEDAEQVLPVDPGDYDLVSVGEEKVEVLSKVKVDAGQGTIIPVHSCRPATGCCPEKPQSCGSLCIPAGAACCGSSTWCDPGFKCCPDGGCSTIEGTCCGVGYCDPGYFCCPNKANCCPDGWTCCGTRLCCRPGSYCCPRGNSCCPMGTTCTGDGHCK